jgi:NAD(P)-dependent dehydrogenase (short-subunit alcohol dehydrogenase family)
MAAPTIGILGGYGNIGRRIVTLLLEQTNAHLVIAGRHILRAREAARDWNARYGAERVCATYAHAADADSVRRAFEGVQLLVVASPTGRFARDTATAALQICCDWLDIQFYTPKLRALSDLSSEIARAGRCFITDAGLHPGLPAQLVRYAVSCFDTLEAASVFAVVNPAGGFPRTPSLYEFCRELMRFQAGTYRDGVWRFSSGLGLGEIRQATFGFGFGARSCMPMMLEEMRALPDLIPNLQETGFYIAGFNWFTDWVAMPLLLLAGKVLPTLWVKPAAWMLHWATRLFATPPFGAIIRLQACGSLAGQRQNLMVECFHPDPFSFTAAAAVAGVLQYLQGRREKGVWLAGHLLDPAQTLSDLQRMGVHIVSEQSALQGTCPFCKR